MIPEKVMAILKANDLEFYEFPEGTTPTAITAAQMLKVKVGQIAKSILFICKSGRAYLVVCPGDRKVSLSKLKKIAGEKPRLADETTTLQLTGFSPGSVCPFGLLDINIIVDLNLREYDVVFPAAGTSGSAVETSFEELVRITGAKIADVSNPMSQS